MMAPDRRTPYRPLGVSLRDFARGRIRTYVPGGDLVSRSSLPPSWAADTREPLGWDTPAQPPVQTQAAPAESVDIDALVSGPMDTSPAPQANVVQRAEAPVMDREEARLRAIMAAHEAKNAAAMADSPPPVQRTADLEAEAATEAAAGQAESSAEPAAPMPRRRRGQVVDVTPPQPTGIFDERLWDNLPTQPETASESPSSDAAKEEPGFFEQAAPDTISSTGQPAAPELNASAPAPAAGTVQRSALIEDAPQPESTVPSPPAVVEFSASETAGPTPHGIASNSTAPPAVRRMSASQPESTSASSDGPSESAQTVVSAPSDAFEALLSQAEAPAKSAAVTPSSAGATPGIQRKVDTPAPSDTLGAPSSAQPPTPASPVEVQRAEAPPAVQRTSEAPAALVPASTVPPTDHSDDTVPIKPVTDAVETAVQRAEAAPIVQRTPEAPAAPAPASAVSAEQGDDTVPIKPMSDAVETAVQRAEAPPAVQRTPDGPAAPASAIAVAPTRRSDDTVPIKPMSDAVETAVQRTPEAPAAPASAIAASLTGRSDDTAPIKPESDAADAAAQHAEAQPAIQRTPEVTHRVGERRADFSHGRNTADCAGGGCRQCAAFLSWNG